MQQRKQETSSSRLAKIVLQISSTVIVGTLKHKRQMHRNIVLFQDLQILQCNECQTEVVSSVYSIYYYSGIQSIEHALVSD